MYERRKCLQERNFDFIPFRTTFQFLTTDKVLNDVGKAVNQSSFKTFDISLMNEGLSIYDFCVENLMALGQDIETSGNIKMMGQTFNVVDNV